MARANPDDHTQFVYLRQANAPSTATVSTHIALSTPAGNYPTVPAGFHHPSGPGLSPAGGKRLLRRPAPHVLHPELMTQAQIGNRAVALLYGPKGTDGETVLRYESQPSVKVLSGSVSTTWDASRGDLRLDYVYGGLAATAPAARATCNGAAASGRTRTWPSSTRPSSCHDPRADRRDLAARLDVPPRDKELWKMLYQTAADTSACPASAAGSSPRAARPACVHWRRTRPRGRAYGRSAARPVPAHLRPPP